MLALARALRQRGRVVDVWLSGAFDPVLQCLQAHEQPGRATEKLPTAEYDAVAVLDTGSWGQLEHMGLWLRERREKVIGVDHHRSGDTDFADRIVETRCASCTQALVPMLIAARLRAPVGSVAMPAYTPSLGSNCPAVAMLAVGQPKVRPR